MTNTSVVTAKKTATMKIQRISSQKPILLSTCSYLLETLLVQAENAVAENSH